MWLVGASPNSKLFAPHSETPVCSFIPFPGLEQKPLLRKLKEFGLKCGDLLHELSG